jgi:uncharacterized MAPEG superfamily protein
MDIAQTYEYTTFALGAMALLMLLQLLVADVAGMKSKHTPGASINTDHSNFLFRASRTVANTNESIAVFVLATTFCILSNASPTYTAYAAWGFIAARALYALFYYLNLQILRSVIFGVSLLSLAALLVIGFFI